jgi:hypothetical protein
VGGAGRTVDGMDLLAIALAVVFFAAMLAIIEGIDRI